jgi:hypothetical protein
MVVMTKAWCCYQPPWLCSAHCAPGARAPQARLTVVLGAGAVLSHKVCWAYQPQPLASGIGYALVACFADGCRPA